MTSPLARVADGLRYAALPTFAAMAVVTGRVRWRAGRGVVRAVGAERHVRDVRLDECLPCRALVEADRRSTRGSAEHPGRREDMSEAYTGGCACGAVRYEISA